MQCWTGTCEVCRGAEDDDDNETYVEEGGGGGNTQEGRDRGHFVVGEASRADSDTKRREIETAKAAW